MSMLQLLSSKPPGIPPPPPLPGFFISPGGNDSNTGGSSDPFMSTTRTTAAINASGGTKLAAYFMAGTHNIGAWPFVAGSLWAPNPADPPGSATLHITGTNLGASAVSGITIKNLKFTQTGSGSKLLMVDCARLKILGCSPLDVGYQNFLQIFRPGAGLRLQGNVGIADTWNASGGLFPINIITNDGADYTDWEISDNDWTGGTFPIQVEDQNSPTGVWTDTHFDRNKLRGYGNSSSSIGNIAISLVGSGNPANSGNTCCDNDCAPAGGLSDSVGVEAGLGGCTYRNKIVADYGYSISNARNSLFDGSDLTVGTMAFSQDGASYTSASAAAIEIRSNTRNGSIITGAGSPTNLSPLPSATGLPTNTPSSPYP